MKYLCKVRYLGSDFCGFQVQPGKRTVQGVINEVANDVFGVPCAVTGCSRTDSGVHANAFALTVQPLQPVSLPAEKLPLAMAAKLPPDVAVMEAVAVEDDFHPRYDAKGKEYCYIIANVRVEDPFWVGRAYRFPRYLNAAMLARMQNAADLLKGRHDFSTFMTEGSGVKDTVRTVTEFFVVREGDLVKIFISADGFLYNMVRILVGTLLEVAVGHLQPQDMPLLLEKKDRSCAGPTAPALGLYLNQVFY